MWGYWAGLVAGYCFTLVAIFYIQGCAGSLSGALVLLLGFLCLSGSGESLTICVGPEKWRYRIRQANWPQPILLFVGLLVGATPVIAALILIRSPKTLQAFLWVYAAAFALLFFGLPILSWSALYLLSRRSPSDSDYYELNDLDLH